MCKYLLAFVTFYVLLLSAPLIAEAGGKHHVPPHDHPNPVMPTPVTINNINNYIIEERRCDALGVANNHQFGRNTNALQWSVNAASCEGYGAVSGGLAKKYHDTLIHFTLTGDSKHTAINIGVSGKFQ